MTTAERPFDRSRRRWRLGPSGGPVVVSQPYLPARIYLVGFMGSGKSTVGQLLADRLEWTFTDLDRRVEERAGLSVRRLFVLGGEGRFRSAEYDALREASREGGRSIVALGGGAFSSEVNRALIRRSGVSVWLDVPFRSLVRRVAGDRHRPLAGDRDRLYQLFRARLPFYHEADVRVRAGDASADRVAAEVLKALREDWSIVAERRRLFP
jgi:shikimate kinase